VKEEERAAGCVPFGYGQGKQDMFRPVTTHLLFTDVFAPDFGVIRYILGEHLDAFA
jgi:hypothetical protein